MQEYNLAVIGAGPGGYVAAIRACQIGMKTVIIEKQYWGGVCLNIGCIPSKCLLEDTHLYHELKHSGSKRGILAESVRYDWEAMQARKAAVVKQLTGGVETLLKNNGVARLVGTASFAGADELEVALAEGGMDRLKAGNYIIASGTISTELPHIRPDGEVVITSTEALSLPSVPKALAVIGAGAIGLELGSVFARLGASVTVIEIMPQIIPGAEKELADTLARELKKDGVIIHLESKVTTLEKTPAGAKLEIEGKFNGVIEADRVLLAVGRTPYTQGLNLQAAGVETCSRGFIKVDEDLRTRVPHILAVGDVVGGALLAHMASHQGIGAVEAIAGIGKPSEHAVPSIVYTAPELSSVGLTVTQALEGGHQVKEGKFFFRANGRALAMNSYAGLIKVIGDRETDRLLGVHILGPAAGELIHDAAVALAAEMSLTDYAAVLRAHPTLAEAITEAALATDKRAVHS